MPALNAWAPCDQLMRVGVCRQRTGVAEVALRSDHMVREHGRAKIDGISVDHGQKCQCLVLDSRRFDGWIPVQFIDAIGIADFVQQVRRQRRREIQCPDPGFFANLAGISGRPRRRIVVIAVMAFPDLRSAQSMFLAEVVIDFNIDLLPVVGVEDCSVSAWRNAGSALYPANDGCVQTVHRHAADRGGAVIGIGQRHGVDNLRDVAGGIRSLSGTDRPDSGHRRTH